MDSVLNFPTFTALRRVLNNGENMTVLKDCLEVQRKFFKDVSVLGLFSDSHDQTRFLNLTNGISLYKNALVYTVLGREYPSYTMDRNKCLMAAVIKQSRIPLAKW